MITGLRGSSCASTAILFLQRGPRAFAQASQQLPRPKARLRRRLRGAALRSEAQPRQEELHERSFRTDGSRKLPLEGFLQKNRGGAGDAGYLDVYFIVHLAWALPGGNWLPVSYTHKIGSAGDGEVEPAKKRRPACATLPLPSRGTAE